MNMASPAHDARLLYRIDVAILDMTGVVLLAPDQMFPETTLPNTALSARLARPAHRAFLWYRSGEARLDHPPPDGKI
jgi:hypothetical protein